MDMDTAKNCQPKLLGFTVRAVGYPEIHASRLGTGTASDLNFDTRCPKKESSHSEPKTI